MHWDEAGIRKEQAALRATDERNRVHTKINNTGNLVSGLCSGILVVYKGLSSAVELYKATQRNDGKHYLEDASIEGLKRALRSVIRGYATSKENIAVIYHHLEDETLFASKVSRGKAAVNELENIEIGIDSILSIGPFELYELETAAGMNYE